MESTPDQKFVDSFSAILAGLVLFTIVIIVLAIAIANRTAVAGQQADPAFQAGINERLRPIGDAVVAGVETTAYGRDAKASVLAAMGGTGPAEIVMKTFASADEVYNAACVACHGLGVAGAPKMGDAAAWAPRVAQGMETLYVHAIEGYTGSAGVMPAKGGRSDITDEDVKRSVDYMVEQSR